MKKRKFSCALFYCGKLPQFTFEKSSRCSCPAFISSIPMAFAFFGDFLSLCFSMPKGFSPFWVFMLLFASLCPKVFSLLGIHAAFCFSMPKSFLSFWYSYYFCFSIPKSFLSFGYLYCFLLLYAQRFSLFWVFILLFASLCPKFFLALGIYLTFVSGMPKHLYSSAYNGCFSFHRTVSLSFYTMASALTPPRSPALLCDAAPVRAATGPVSYPQ